MNTTFDQAYSEAILTKLRMVRRMSWPDGVAGVILDSGDIDWQHVVTCSLPPPKPEEFTKEDWICVKDWGKDLSYMPFGRPFSD